MAAVNSDKQKIDERRKFLQGFDDTMIKMWKERIYWLGVVDTGALDRSLAITDPNPIKDALASEANFQWSFVTYGIFQNFGTGRETPRGNPGDIGRDKVRKARHWFDKKYYASFMRLREFLTESLSKEYLAAMSNAFSNKALRDSVTL